MLHKTINSNNILKDTWDKNGDGILQKSEADYWVLNGKGKSITVNGNKIDISGLNPPIESDFEGGEYSLETHQAFIQLPYETAATYGGCSMRCVNGQWRVLSQDYHYEYRSIGFNWNVFSDTARNIATYIVMPKYNTAITLGAGRASIPSIPIIALNTHKFMINIKY